MTLVYVKFIWILGPLRCFFQFSLGEIHSWVSLRLLQLGYYSYFSGKKLTQPK